jgi:hypothetical protein
MRRDLRLEFRPSREHPAWLMPAKVGASIYRFGADAPIRLRLPGGFGVVAGSLDERAEAGGRAHAML